MQEVSAISSSVADAILAALLSKGADTDAIKSRLGIPNGHQEEGVWPLSRFTAMLEMAADDKGDPLFGLKVGKAFQMEGLGRIAAVMRASRTVGDAFQKFTKYLPAFQSNTDYGLEISDDTACLSYRILDASVTLRRQDNLFTIAMEQAFLAELLQNEVSPICVDFQHNPETSGEEYQGYFKCEVRFGRRQNAIYFPKNYLTVGIRSDARHCDRVEAELVEEIKQSQLHLYFSEGIKAWMHARLAVLQSIEIEHAATDFGMSLRTFQRRLSENCVNFRELRNNVRSQIARGMLSRTSVPITSIALYLGFSETSAFSRHFKTYVGITPSQYRMVGLENLST